LTVSRLRVLRLSVASFVFILATLFFLDLGGVIPPKLVNTVLALQYGPAVISALGGTAVAIFAALAVTALTLVAGRVYCSHLCPLGTLQDLFIWSAKRKFIHRRFPYSKPAYLVHYAVTLLAIVSAAAGSMMVLDLLEPYSNFSRILTNLVRPVEALCNNAVASLLVANRIYVMYVIPVDTREYPVVALAAIFLGGIFWLSYKHGRFFCNTLCPVGGILGLLSRFSLLRITIDTNECIDCGLCERVCRAKCVDAERRTIDFAACVGCFDCIGSCPIDGMHYRTRWWRPRSEPPLSTDRRSLLIGASSGLLGLLKPGPGFARENQIVKSPIVPPGGRSIRHFTDHCTACHLCVAECPSHVLQPTFLEYGIAGLMQPHMDYSVNYCTFECTLCGEVCPTGAIERVTKDEKKLLQIGKATFVKEDCIVETKKTDCGACSEHCPTKAVHMIPYGVLLLPQVDEEFCIGCGACEHACPVKPRKAIAVSANAVHMVAKKREDAKTRPAPAPSQDFPF